MCYLDTCETHSCKPSSLRTYLDSSAGKDLDLPEYVVEYITDNVAIWNSAELTGNEAYEALQGIIMIS